MRQTNTTSQQITITINRHHKWQSLIATMPKKPDTTWIHVQRDQIQFVWPKHDHIEIPNWLNANTGTTHTIDRHILTWPMLRIPNNQLSLQQHTQPIRPVTRQLHDKCIDPLLTTAFNNAMIEYSYTINYKTDTKRPQPKTAIQHDTIKTHDPV